MTKAEAKNDIHYIISALDKRRMAPCGWCDSYRCIPNPHECAKDDFVIDKAIEALEKQIPRKPRKYKASQYVMYFECPRCDNKIQAGERR